MLCSMLLLARCWLLARCISSFCLLSACVPCSVSVSLTFVAVGACVAVRAATSCACRLAEPQVCCYPRIGRRTHTQHTHTHTHTHKLLSPFPTNLSGGSCSMLLSFCLWSFGARCSTQRSAQHSKSLTCRDAGGVCASACRCGRKCWLQSRASIKRLLLTGSGHTRISPSWMPHTCRFVALNATPAGHVLARRCATTETTLEACFAADIIASASLPCACWRICLASFASTH
jgi:hypothetical protein